ncbi:MAG: Gfo/Idh/MocA family oxidoreductase [Planctomycetes bacterium]|nr:Gfo/Idh/MocA family oxidoreductase [Planctomycetota bacterium]
MFKSAMLGCGGRAKGHAKAYEHVKKTQLAAVCDMNEERLNPFAEEFGIPQKYTDIHEMLDKEKPDILHIVTQPDLRVQLLTLAHEAKVPAVIVEKPLALDSEDFKAIREISKTTTTKMCVNHQLRFHPRLLDLLSDVQEGRIGDVQFIDASSRLNLAGQGTHVLNLVFWMNGGMHPDLVFGNACGTSQFDGTHPAPDMAVAQLNFPNRVRCLIANGVNAVATSDDEKNHMHKRIAVYGTRGFVHWKMMSWERSTTKVDFESGEKDYRDEDVLGQAGLTDAMCDWLEDDKKVHPNCLEQSLAETNTVLGLFASTVHGKPIDLPYEPEDGLLGKLRAKLE